MESMFLKAREFTLEDEDEFPSLEELTTKPEPKELKEETESEPQWEVPKPEPQWEVPKTHAKRMKRQQKGKKMHLSQWCGEGCCSVARQPAMPFLEAPQQSPLVPMQPGAPQKGQMDGPSSLCPLGEWKKVEQGWTKVVSVMDSGAIASVIPRSTLPEYPVRPSPGSRRGQLFTTAAGQEIPNEGEQVVPALTGQGAPTQLKNQIADVTMPLSAVGEYCNAGNRVIFGRSGGVIQDVTTGAETHFAREDGIYLMEHWIPPLEIAQAAGFTRHGR